MLHSNPCVRQACSSLYIHEPISFRPHSRAIPALRIFSLFLLLHLIPSATMEKKKNKTKTKKPPATYGDCYRQKSLSPSKSQIEKTSKITSAEVSQIKMKSELKQQHAVTAQAISERRKRQDTIDEKKKKKKKHESSLSLLTFFQQMHKNLCPSRFASAPENPRASDGRRGKKAIALFLMHSSSQTRIPLMRKKQDSSLSLLTFFQQMH